MKIDLTYKTAASVVEQVLHLDSMASLLKFGHFGTHFDCMGKTFPLENCERNGVAFDVHMVRGREVSPDDIDLAKVQADQRCADAD